MFDNLKTQRQIRREEFRRDLWTFVTDVAAAASIFVIGITVLFVFHGFGGF